MNILGKLEVSRSGDNIEVRLFDSSFNMYFKRRVNLSDKKGMRRLLSELHGKGVDFRDFGDFLSDQWW